MYQEHIISQEQVQAFFYRVYAWMAGALVVTASVAYAVASQPTLMIALLSRPLVLWTLIITQLVIVFVFSSRLQRLSYRSALVLFCGYVFLTGVTLSGILWRYPIMSILRALIISGGMFASAAVYGYFTQADLSKMRSFIFMCLIGFLFALLSNLFIQSSLWDLVISIVGVVLFTVLTALDVNAIKKYALIYEANGGHTYHKMALLGALQLYLDFINLFLNMLRLTDGRKRQ